MAVPSRRAWRSASAWVISRYGVSVSGMSIWCQRSAISCHGNLRCKLATRSWPSFRYAVMIFNRASTCFRLGSRRRYPGWDLHLIPEERVDPVIVDEGLDVSGAAASPGPSLRASAGMG
ncbi:hypothetical protein NESM_000903200 [Novymonas esmeraldas]|uniref:Uncharacterized protein n=1 Tax=Novymonas esmeraldas TaxID=1808958 RepID=A0AAW0F270_9TRYP